MKGKKWGGGGREKVDQIKNFYYLHGASVSSQKKSQILWDFQREIRGKIQDKFHSKTIVIEKEPILQKFFGQISLESNLFCAHFVNGNIAKLFFWVLSCTTTTTETWTTCKPAILCSKPPLALQCHLDLVLSCTRFFLYQISSFALLTTSSEMCHIISCTGQCPVFRNNNLRTLGSFGTFSR